MEGIPQMRKSAEEVLKNLGAADAAELRRFANGEQSDMTIEAGWTESELRQLAQKVVAEQAGK